MHVVVVVVIFTFFLVSLKGKNRVNYKITPSRNNNNIVERKRERWREENDEIFHITNI